ncbi:uncharacterized protein [Typha latifolia]|uniref:uncharacterized protein n=1 Tax=Typha latifolia TaxID=4733 RepID=UPI003C2EAE85
MRSWTRLIHLKSLSLQMIIPWCFHVSEDESSAAAAPTRVVDSDGRVHAFDGHVSAVELMSAHPRHLLCLADSFYVGQKVPSLSQADRLLPGRTYFLLPSQFFHSPLSFASLAASFPLGKKTQLPSLRPFDVQKTSAGEIKITVSAEFLEGLEKEGDKNRKGRRVCTTEALEKDYKQLVRSRSWKPKLETIGESDRRRTGGPFCKIRRKKKKKTSSRSQHHHL